MKTHESTASVTAEATPAGVGTAVGSTLKNGFLKTADALTIDVSITAGAGGTLDVYLQRKLAADSWADWIHFPQVTAAATARYSVSVDGAGSSIVAVGRGTDASPGVALAANSVVNVLPGGDIRLVYVAGAGAAGAGAVTLRVQPITYRT